MSEFTRKQLMQYAAEVCADLTKAEAEITNLKQQCGVFQQYESLTTYNRSYDMSKESDWRRFCQDYEADKPKAEKNLELQKHNDDLLKKLVALITGTGLATTSWTYKRNKRVDVDCQWYELLKHAAPSNPRTLPMLENTYLEKKAAYEKAIEEKRKASERAEQQRLQEEAAQKRIREESLAVVQCAALLGAEPTGATVESLLQIIRDTDKYIDLALGGEQTRGSWLDGPWAAENALGRFVPENETDRAIVRNWQDQLNDFDDGRCFRDCDWNYGRVFTLASDNAKAAYDLIKDYVRLSEFE